MAREREDYRLNLEQLGARFPGRFRISLKEACELLGKDPRTLLADESFPARRSGREYIITLAGLARWLS